MFSMGAVHDSLYSDACFMGVGVGVGVGVGTEVCISSSQIELFGKNVSISLSFHQANHSDSLSNARTTTC